MAKTRSENNERIGQEQWLQFLDQFVAINEGRPVRLEQFGGELGDENLGDDLQLLSMNYDPGEKGDTLTVSTGRDKVEYEHRIEKPRQIWLAKDPRGDARAIEVIDENGVRTVISLVQ